VRGGVRGEAAMMFDAMLAEGMALFGSVSNVEMVTPRVLICKVLLLSISLFETSPLAGRELPVRRRPA